EAAGEDEVEQRRSASARFEIRPTLGIDRRLRWPGSRSLIYTSTVAHEDGFALPPLRLSGAGGGRRPHHLLSPAGRDSFIFGHAARLDPGAGTPRNRCLPATCGTGAAPACAPPPPPLLHGLLPRPQAAEEPSQVFFVLHGTPGGFHQQESQQAVALLGDVAVARGVAAGMLAGVRSEERRVGKECGGGVGRVQ